MFVKRILKKVYYFICDRKYVRNRKLMLNKNGKKIFQEFIEIANRNKLSVWLCYGTLLGFIRENGLMKHDDDFDVGCWYKSYSKVFEQDLINNGFFLEHQFKADEGYSAFEQTFVKNGVYIDIFYHYEDEKTIWTHVFHREKNDNLPENVWRVRKLDFTKSDFKSVDFIGTKVLIPENSEQYLVETYGENWRIPDKNYDWRKGPRKDSILPGIYGRMF